MIKSLFLFLTLLPVFTVGQSETDSLIRLLPDIDNYSEKVNVLHQIGWSVMYSSPDSALGYYQKALNLGLENHNDTLVGKSYNRIGIAYDISGNWDSSLANYALAFERALIIKDTITMASIFSNKGLIYWNKNEFKRAITAFLNAQNLFEAIANKEGVANCYHNIALVHMDLDDINKSIDYHTKALAIRTELDIKSGVMDSKTNLALLFLLNGKTDEANKYLNEGIEYYESIGQYYALGKVYSHKGRLNRMLDELDSAVFFYKKSIQVSRQIGAKSFKASSLYSLADVYFAMKDHATQIKYLLQAEEIALETNNSKMIALVNNALGKAYNLTGNFKESSHRYIYSENLRDSLFAIEKQEAIASLEIKYETEKKENQINKQRLLISAQKEEINQKEIETVNAELASSKMRNWIFLLSFLTITVIGLAYFLIQRNKNRLSEEKNKALLEEKENSLRAVVESEDNERKRIAKNLHDSVIQQLVSLKFGINAVDTENKKELLELLDTSTYELRDLSHQLMPKGLIKLGLEKALDDLLNTSLKHTDITYEYEFSNIEKRIPETIELNLYRVVQELINNLIKHSKSTKLDMHLYQIKDSLHLVFEDNGVGFDVEKETDGLGMRSINSRIAAMEGSIHFQSGDQKGTLVALKIPLP